MSQHKRKFEWLFGGVGTAIIAAILGWVLSRPPKPAGSTIGNTSSGNTQNGSSNNTQVANGSGTVNVYQGTQPPPPERTGASPDNAKAVHARTKKDGRNSVIAPGARINVQTSGPNSPAVGINTGTVSVLNGDTDLIHSLTISLTLNVPTDKQKVDSSREYSLGLFCPAGLVDTQNRVYRLVVPDRQFEDSQISEETHRFGFVYVPEDSSELIGKRVDFLESITTFAMNCSDFLKTTGMTAHSTSDIVSLDLLIRINGIAVATYSGKGSLQDFSSRQGTVNVESVFRQIEGLYTRAVATQATARPQ